MKKVLIIGATSGIGRGLAELYARKGCTVGATGRREHLLDELRGQSGQIHTKAFDVLSDTAIDSLRELIAEMGGLDMAIYCSGSSGVNPSIHWDIERNVAEVNVMAFTRIANFLYGYFAEQGSGQLAAISSMASVRGIDVSPAYSASKAYMARYLRELRRRSRREGHRNLRMSTIMPGFVNTAIIDPSTPVFWMVDVQTAVELIYKNLTRGRKVAYVPTRWRMVAFVARMLPSYLQERV